MVSILYSGQTLPIDDVDIEELTTVILDTCAQGAHSWISLSTTGANARAVRLLIGPGIPVAILGA